MLRNILLEEINKDTHGIQKLTFMLLVFKMLNLKKKKKKIKLSKG